MAGHENRELNSEERQDIRMLYEHSADEIQFLKSQQWTITNYVVAVYVGVVAVSELIKGGSGGGAYPVEIGILLVVTLGALLAGLWIVRKINKDLLKYRKRIDEARARFSDEFREAQKAEDLVVREGTSRAFAGILTAVIVLGGLATGYLIAGRQLVEAIVSRCS